jgi:hypothetical protein
LGDTAASSVRPAKDAPVRAAISPTIEACVAREGTEVYASFFNVCAAAVQPPLLAEHSSVMGKVLVSSYIGK